MEFTSVIMGVGLSAAAGFRVFVPFLITGIAAAQLKTGEVS